MSVRLIGILVAVVAMAAVGAGCGGGGNSSSSASTTASGESGEAVTTSSLSKAQFVKQATVLCRRAKVGLIEKVEQYVVKHLSDNLPREVLNANAAKAEILPVMEARTAIVRELGAPAGEEEQVEAMLAAQEEAIAKVRQAKTLSEKEGPRPYFAQSAEEFAKFQLAECGYSL